MSKKQQKRLAEITQAMKTARAAGNWDEHKSLEIAWRNVVFGYEK
jgi:hypothetical protein